MKLHKELDLAPWHPHQAQGQEETCEFSLFVANTTTAVRRQLNILRAPESNFPTRQSPQRAQPVPPNSLVRLSSLLKLAWVQHLALTRERGAWLKIHLKMKAWPRRKMDFLQMPLRNCLLHHLPSGADPKSQIWLPWPRRWGKCDVDAFAQLACYFLHAWFSAPIFPSILLSLLFNSCI